MDRRIVKLDALSDTDGTGAKDDDPFFAAVFAGDKFGRFVLIVACGVKIRRLRFKFGRAGVDHFVNAAARVGDFLAADAGNRRIGIAGALGGKIERVIQRSGGERLFHVADFDHFSRNHSSIMVSWCSCSTL